MSFFYCIATLLEFAGVHYFTKVGSGEHNPMYDEEEWEDIGESIEYVGGNIRNLRESSTRKRNSLICPIYNVSRLTPSVWDELIGIFLAGSIASVSADIVEYVNHGTHHPNGTTQSEEMETNLVMLFGWRQIQATASTWSHRKMFVSIFCPLVLSNDWFEWLMLFRWRQ